ncbi:hypothetical protein JZ751_000675 [Albula glossodonta]|uniref:Uncharacterized protein n=1 Tax=Albula glossodonta TaxID=121402 RepID=A0A8T2PWW6_9TELE|nr:hypothetical protein JZ751_000675 [Albula glossodonta]
MVFDQVYNYQRSSLHMLSADMRFICVNTQRNNISARCQGREEFGSQSGVGTKGKPAEITTSILVQERQSIFKATENLCNWLA